MGVTEQWAAYGSVLQDSAWLLHGSLDLLLAIGQLEGGNRLDQFARLLVQTGSGSGHFFHQGGVLLCGVVHLLSLIHI